MTSEIVICHIFGENLQEVIKMKLCPDFMLNFICSTTLRNIVADGLEIVELSIADIFRFGMMAH